jgi:hypothetical protein
MGIGNDKVMNGVREEIHKFNDILLADFQDNYYTSTIKVFNFLGQKFSFHFPQMFPE